MSIPGSQLGTEALVDSLGGYVETGVSRFVIDIGWRSLDDARDRLNQLQSDLDAVPGRATSFDPKSVTKSTAP